MLEFRAFLAVFAERVLSIPTCVDLLDVSGAQPWLPFTNELTLPSNSALVVGHSQPLLVGH